MMVSEAKLAANRRNAQWSTGPRTPEGKARASRNALKHGLLSEQALLASEDATAYEEFGAALREELAPVGPWEEVLAEQVIAGAWRLRRAAWMETCLLDRTLEPALEQDAQWRRGRWDAARQRAKQEGRAEADVPHPCPRSRPGEMGTRFAGEALMRMMYEGNYLDVLRRYERAIERGMHEAMKALQAARAARASGAGEAEPSRCHGPTSEEDRAAAAAGAECDTNPSGLAALRPDEPGAMACGGNDAALDSRQRNQENVTGFACGTNPSEEVQPINDSDPPASGDAAESVSPRGKGESPASQSGVKAAALQSVAGAECDTNPSGFAALRPGEPAECGGRQASEADPKPGKAPKSRWLREQEDLAAWRAHAGRR